jgi:hypothetical protein
MLAPRFEYRVRDEFAFAETNKMPAAQEQGIIQRQETALQRFQTNQRGSDLSRWLTSEAIPFNENWVAAIEALPLAPRRLTAHRREVLLKILTLRIENYRDLLGGVEKKDRRVLEKLRAKELIIAQETVKFAGLGLVEQK